MKFTNIFIPIIVLICLNYGFAVFLSVTYKNKIIEFDEFGVKVYNLNKELIHQYHYAHNN
jgi:hypothetical protein